MVNYFKITNIDEIHNGYSYGDGLNLLPEILDETGTNGLYFTTIEYIPKYYYIGTNLREITVPSDSQIKIINMDDKYRANKIILGKKHSLFDPKTYEIFGLNMEYNIHLVNYASAHNNLNFLSQWKHNNWNLKYTKDSIDLASENGHIDILEWWKNSGLKMKYSIRAIEWANESGQTKVLDWWFKNNFEIKCSAKSIQIAAKNGFDDIVNWWDNYKTQYLRMTLFDSKILNQGPGSIISVTQTSDQWLKILMIIIFGWLMIYFGSYFNLS